MADTLIGKQGVANLTTMKKPRSAGLLLFHPVGAEDEIRTRDTLLGKQVLCH